MWEDHDANPKRTVTLKRTMTAKTMKDISSPPTSLFFTNLTFLQYFWKKKIRHIITFLDNKACYYIITHQQVSENSQFHHSV